MKKWGGKDVHDEDGAAIKGLFEGFVGSGLEKLNTSFSRLSEWAQSCKTHNIYAGSMVSIVGTQAHMSVVPKDHSGPFGRW